jgi:opacity protein-like surface antigen
MSRRKLAVCVLAAGLVGVSAPAGAQPVYNWSGFYGGAHVGTVVGGGSGGAVEDSNDPPYNALGDSWTFDLDGGINVGAQAGFSLQRHAWVYGVEADFDKYGFDGSGSSSLSDDTVASGGGGLAIAIRGRVGYATRRWLVFGTAGLFNLKTTASVVDDCSNDECGAALIDASGTAWQSSFVYGAGVEYALRGGSRAQISLKAEWLHLGSDDSIPVTAADNLGDTHSWVITTKPPHNAIRAGVNLRFP